VLRAFPGARGIGNFFYGGGDGVAALLSETASGALSGGEDRRHLHAARSALCQRSRRRRWRARSPPPHRTSCGSELSTPKQERWMAEHIVPAAGPRDDRRRRRRSTFTPD
jgi:hypothetical protein